MVWQNTINSITNQDIDLKILRDMNCSMAHICVTVNFSGKCLLLGATFNLWKKVRSGPSRWWTTWGPWSGPYTGPFRSSERICGTHHLSNMYAETIELHLIGFTNIIGLEKYLIRHEARFWVAHCIWLHVLCWKMWQNNFLTFWLGFVYQCCRRFF